MLPLTHALGLALLLAVGMSAAADAPPRPALRIHVAPDGAEQGAALGSAAQPAGSLAAAQRLVRAALAAAGPQRQPIEVLIAPGRYVLDAPLTLGPEDSGLAGAPVVWRAAQPGSVLISGGTVLASAGAGPASDVARFDVPGGKPADWTGGGQLYVDGQRATLARQPDLGAYGHVQSAIPLPGETDKERGSQAFHPGPGVRAWIDALPAADRARAVVHVMQSWTSGLHRIDGLQPPDGLRLVPRSIWPYRSKGLNQRFWIENVPAAFDAPGEWIGQGDRVLYRPRPGEAAGPPGEVVLARLDRLLVLQGDTASGRRVESIEFHGLRFAHARLSVPPQGYQDNQAAQALGAAIEVDEARHIVFDRCGIAHTGAHGLWLRRGVRESRITRSVFQDLGAGAVRIGLQKQPAGDPQATGANTVAENRITGTGRVMPGAVAVWIGQSFDNTVSHNAISDTHYTGISVGWSWGYAPATSGGNRIVGNLLFDIGRGMLTDQAAIYTLGVSPGTLIRGNVIREVRGHAGYGSGVFGLYNDQGSSGITMRHNIVVGTDGGGYHLHWGRDLRVEDNLFALGRRAELRLTRPDESAQLLLSGNVLIPAGREPLDGRFPPAVVTLQGNRVSDRQAGGPLRLQPCGSGCTASSASVTPGPGPKDLQFSGLPPDTAAWVRKVLAEAGPPPEVLQAAGLPPPRLAGELPRTPAPAVTLTLDLAGLPPGQRPATLRYVPADRPEAIQPSGEDPPAPGGRCLLFRDDASFAARSEPHAYSFLNHERGWSTARFALRHDPAARFVHEWRDGERPFQVGPQLIFDAEGVKADGRLIARSTPGDWLDLTVRAPLARPAGRWTLEVRRDGALIGQATDLRFLSPGWQHLHWIGFLSHAAVASTACLAGLSVVNDADETRPPPLKP